MALITDLGELGRDGGVDAPSDDAPASDTPNDAPTSGDTIALVEKVANETGMVQQTHLVWAQASKRWVLFYICYSDTMHLRTRISSDFVSWIEGPALLLPYTHGGDGREFSVSYALIAATDVVHIAMSHDIANNDRRHTHTRAVVQGDVVLYGTPEVVTTVVAQPPTSVNPDAPATIVTQAGVVIDASGWALYGDGGPAFNEEVFVAANSDDGNGLFSSGGWTRVDLEKPVRYVSSRELLELPTGVATFWDLADVKPNPTNVRAAFSSAKTTWSPPASVFSNATNGGEAEDDWSVAWTASTSTLHAVRQTLEFGLEYATTKSTVWSPAGEIPPISRAAGSGLLLLSSGTNLMLATIALDGSIAVSHLAGTWSPWTTILATPRQRAFLSGFSDGTHAALIWTQIGTSGFHEVGGMLVTP